MRVSLAAAAVTIEKRAARSLLLLCPRSVVR
jgi:hypothetical protein